MPVERSGTCDQCGKPTDTSVKPGIQVRHGRCQLSWLRSRWLKADEHGRRVIEQLAECVRRECEEYEARGGDPVKA